LSYEPSWESPDGRIYSPMMIGVENQPPLLDYNLIHLAEEKLLNSDSDWERYAYWLAIPKTANTNGRIVRVVLKFAKPQQRAIALIKTMEVKNG